MVKPMPNHSVNEVREDRRLTGKIARLSNGYGFIEGSDGRDYFFHWSELSRFAKQFRNLNPGDEVDFQPGRTDNGPRAFQIMTLDVG
jgi:CspA family cold shock protein